MMKNENGMARLEAGDVFTVDCYKSAPSKKFPDKTNAKILTTTGDIVYTSSAKIVKILDELTKDYEIDDLSNYTFEVVKTGEFNGHPILSLKCDNPMIQKKIKKLLF